MGADDKLYLCISQYDFKVNGMIRFGGGIYLDTDKGNYLLKQRQVSENRVIFEEEVKQLLYNNNFINTDFCLRNINGDYVTEGMYGETYTCRRNYHGNMCDMNTASDLALAAKALAGLHNASSGYTPNMVRKSSFHLIQDDSLFYSEASETKSEQNDIEDFSRPGEQYYTKKDIPYREGLVSELFDKRITELKRTCKYLSRQKNPHGTELKLLELLPEYIKKCDNAMKLLNRDIDERLYKSAYNEGHIIHGSFTGHNIIFIKDSVAVTGFEKARIGSPVHDLYMFIKKAGEKNNWDKTLIKTLLDYYASVRPICSDEKNILMARLFFPEKFWKTVNMYFNGKKNWIPGRVDKKLEDVCRLQDAMEDTINSL